MTNREAFTAKLTAYKAARAVRAQAEREAQAAAEVARLAEIASRVAARPAIDPARVEVVMVGAELGIALGIAVGHYGAQGVLVPGARVRARLASGAVVDLTRTERTRALVDLCLRLAAERDDEASAMTLAATLLAVG